MSLLNILSTPLLPLFSSPTASPTPLTGFRLNPCATPLWGRPSGHLAGPIPNTGYEPKFCIDVSSEHTPINLSTRNMSFQQEYDATITACEDLNLPRHSGASSSRASTRQQAQFPLCLLKQGSLGPSLTKVSADYYSCKQYTCSAHVFLMHSRCAVILSLTLRTDLTHHAWLKNHGPHC